MKRRYIYSLILTMSICLTACGRTKKDIDTSSDNYEKTVSQTTNLSKTETSGDAEVNDVKKKNVVERETENNLPMIEFDDNEKNTESDTIVSDCLPDVSTKSTETSTTIPTSPSTQQSVDETIESHLETNKKTIELPFAPINQIRYM